MFRYLVAAVGFFGTAHLVSKGLQSSQVFQARSAAVDVDQLMKDGAAELNRQRGTHTGGAVFTGASVQGRTLLVELTLKNAPARFDPTAASERLLVQVKQRFCVARFQPVIRQGGAVVYRYQTEGGRVLFDARVDATVCRMPV